LVGALELAAEEAGHHVLALRGEIAREGSKLQDVVVHGAARDEGAEPVAPRDEAVALQHLEGVAEGHERDAEVLGEPALIVEPLAGRELT